MMGSIALSTVLTLLIVGCSDKETTQTQTTQASITKVSGQSTLASARVCLDTNHNDICDSEDPSTTADERGSYTLESDDVVAEGTVILAQDGYNLILEQNNNGRFRLVTRYDSQVDAQNINTMSSLLTQMVRSGAYSDEEAKAYISETYHIALEELSEDPISLATQDKETLWLLVHGIELGYSKSVNSNASLSPSRSPQQDGYVTPNLEDAELFLEDEHYLSYDVGTYITRISLKIETFYDEVIDYLRDTFSLCIWYCPSGSALEYENLAGIWYVHSRYGGEDMCVGIDRQDNYLEYHEEGNKLYSIYFADISNSITIIDGWDILEYYKIQNQVDVNEFELLDNGNTIGYYRMESVTACQERIALGSAIREGVTKIKGQVNIPDNTQLEGVYYKNNGGFFSILKEDSNGSFTYQSRTANEDPFISDESGEMFFIAWLKVDKGSSIRIPFEVKSSDISFEEEGHLANIGTKDIELTHLKVCVNNVDGSLVNGRTYYFLDNTWNNEVSMKTDMNSGIAEFDLQRDGKDHTLYMYKNYDRRVENNISRMVFNASDAVVDLSQNCVSMESEWSRPKAFQVEKINDNNQTAILVYGPTGIDVQKQSDTDKVYSDVSINKNGSYSIYLDNETRDATVTKGVELTLNVDGVVYKSTVEEETTLNALAFTFYYYNGEISVIYDAFGRRLK